MTDQNPDSPSNEEATDDAFERELDEVLTKASSLASELAVAVGTEEPPEAGAEPTAQASTPPPEAAEAETPHPGLEAELNNLESLLDKTDREISETTGSEDPNVSQDVIQPKAESEGEGTDPGDGPTSPTPSEKGEEVPDFMSELTETEETPAHSAATSTPTIDETSPFSSNEAVKRGVVGTGMMGVVGSAPSSPEGSQTATELADKEQPPEEKEPAKPIPGLRDKLARILGSTATRLSPTAYKVAERSVGLLESVDRPLTRIGETPRRLLGWVAVATMGTAMIVFLWSFLIA